MAGKTKEKQNKRYIPLKERQGHKSEDSLQLKNMTENEIVDALSRHGPGEIIADYREAKLDPPVDLLLSYFEMNPQDIKENESILLQKAYGSDFMQAQYTRLGAGNMAKMGVGKKIAGWFGRKFGSYIRLKHDKSKRDLKTLEQASNILLKGIDKMDREGPEDQSRDIKSLDALLTSKLNEIDHSMQGVGSGGISQEGRIEVDRPNTSSVLRRAAEKGMDGKAKDGVRKAEEDQGYKFIEEWKSYKNFIHLHGYKCKKYDYDVMQFISSEIALGMGSKELFVLKDTDFILTFDRQAGTEMVSMSKGSGSIQLGALTISAKNMSYISLNNTFKAASVSAALEAKPFFSANGSIAEVTVDESGITFEKLEATVKELNVFNGALNVTDARFQMNKDKDGWKKGISMGGLGIEVTNAFSLQLTSVGQTDGINAWMLSEESNTSQVSGNTTSWKPSIQNASATLNIGDGLSASLEAINFNENQLSTGTAQITMKANFQGNSAEATASADEVAYEFSSKKLLMKNLSAKAKLTIGEHNVETELTGMNYSEGAITVDAMSGTLFLGGEELTLIGEGISYSPKGALEFKKLGRTINGDMTLLDLITLKELSIGIEKQESEEGQNKEQDKSGSNGNGYEVSLKVGQGAIDAGAAGFIMNLESASFSVSDKGELVSGEITGIHLDIANGMITAAGAAMSYSKEEQKLSATDIQLNLLLGGASQSVTASTVEYGKQSGFAATGISAQLELNVGSNKMTAELTNASYDNEVGFKAGTASVSANVMGRQIKLDGEDLEYSPEKEFSFKSLSATLGDWEPISDFILTGVSLAVRKNEANEHTVIAASEKVGFKTQGVSLNTGATSFEITKNKLSQASIEQVEIDAAGIFSVTAQNVLYSNDEELSLEITNLVAVKTQKDGDGPQAELSIQSGQYRAGKFSLSGLNGSLSASLAGMLFKAEMIGGGYQDGKLTVDEATVDAEIMGQGLKFKGTDLSYSRAEGMDYSRLELSTKKEIKIGSFLTLESGGAALDKTAKGVQLTISGSATANIDKIAALSLTNAVLSVSNNKVESATMGEGALNIGDNMVVIGIEDVSYLSDVETFSASNLVGNATFGDNNLTMKVETLNYNEKNVSLTGVSMSAAVNFGSNSIYIGFENGKFDNKELTIGSLTSNMNLYGTEIRLNGSGLVFNKEGTDFNELEGEIKGRWTPFEKSGISITDASVSVKKKEKSYSTELKSQEVSIETGGINLNASGMSFQIEEGHLKSADVANANLDINNKMIAGSVENLHYEEAEKGNYSFTSDNVKVSMNAGEQAKAEVSIEKIGYQDKLFTLTNMNALFSVAMGGNSMEAQFLEASYDATKGLSAKKAAISADILDTKISLSGEDLSYTPEKVIDFKTLTAALEKDLTVFDTIVLQNASVSVEKGDSGHYTVKVATGIGMKNPDIFSLSAGAVETTLSDGKLQALKIQNATLKVKQDLINVNSAEVDLSFDEGKVSAKDLKINVKSEALQNVPGLGSISQFLGGIGVTVPKLSYSKGDTLEYSDFKFDATAPIISVGKFFTLTPDFKNNTISAKADWMFPGGTMVESKDKGKEETVASEGSKEGSKNAKPEMKYQASSLFDVGVSVVVVPGINFFANLDFGAGFHVGAELSVQKTDKTKYRAGGEGALDGQAYVAAKLGASAGIPCVASILAYGQAKAVLNLTSKITGKTTFDYENLKPTFSDTIVTYKMSADAELTLSAKVGTKVLFFEEAVLYEKELGNWKLGEINFEGGVGLNEKEGTFDDKSIKNSFMINKKAPSKDVIGKEAVPKEKKTVGGIDEIKEDSVEALEAKREEREKQRKAIEEVLINADVDWAGDGDKATRLVVSQVRKLSKIYEKELKDGIVKLTNLHRKDEALTRKYKAQGMMLSVESHFENFFSRKINELYEDESKKGTKQRPENILKIQEEFYRRLERLYIDRAIYGINTIYSFCPEEYKRVNSMEAQDTTTEKRDVVEKEMKRIDDLMSSNFKAAKDPILLEHYETTKLLVEKMLAYDTIKRKTKWTITLSHVDDDVAKKEYSNLMEAHKKANAGEWEEIEERCKVMLAHHDVLETAGKEVFNLSTLHNDILTFLAPKTLTGTESERQQLKSICDRIKGNKIYENISEMKDSEEQMKNFFEK